jgi:gamma-glutamyltranspeptidase/glutathione hydrolase
MTTYRGVGVHAIGANTQGVATLQILNILENFDLKGAGFQSPLSIHLQAEAKRLAYEDRARSLCGSGLLPGPFRLADLEGLCAQRAKLIRPNRLMENVRPGRLPRAATPPISASPTRTG